MRIRIAVSLIITLCFTLGVVKGKARTLRGERVNALILRGRVIGVKTEIPPERLFANVTVNLTIEFVNVGTKPIIMLSEFAPLYVGKAITKTPIAPINWPVPEGDNILCWSYRGPSDFGVGRWGTLRNSL